MCKTRQGRLEKRKRQCWVYLLGYYVDWNFMPTLQEIADNAFGKVKLTREGARYILKGLESDGMIRIDKRKRRGIKLGVVDSEWKGGENDGT